MKTKHYLAFIVLTLLLGAGCTNSPAQPAPLKVLTISGDWKSQPWYQDVWMQGKGDNGRGTPPVYYRGRFIADAVEKTAPLRFQFTDITNYTAAQYGDANYFS